MKLRQGLRSTTKGEIGALLHGRADLALWRAALAKCRNFIPTMQGPVTRRGGSRFRGAAVTETETGNLIEFVWSPEQSYAIEFGNGVARFWQPGGLILDGSSPYEIASPFTAAEARRLSYDRDDDSLFLAHPAKPLQVLQRRGHTDWSFVVPAFARGPFRAPNDDQGKTVRATAAAVGGSTTLTAAGFTFDPGQVGALWRIEERSVEAVPEWVGNKDVTIGTQVRFNGRVYEAAAGGTTSANPPIHTEGNWTDAPGGVTWSYQHDTYGVVEITSVNPGGATAVAIVRRAIPDSSVGAATWLWAEGAFSPLRGYVDHVLVVENRLGLVKGSTIYLSATADFTNFALEDGAMALPLAARDPVTWVADIGVLALGSEQVEQTIRASTLREALTRDNVLARRETDEGGARLRPVAAGRAVLFVSADRERFCEFLYDLTTEGYGTADLTIEHPDVLAGGVVDLAFARNPHRIVWLALADGAMAALTYRRDQDIIGWHRHHLPGGVVESLCTLPTEDKRGHTVWMIVRRTINGVERRYVETLELPWTGQETVKPWLLDSALRYSGPPVSRVGGLGHLEGETVAIYADGAMQSDAIVTGGEVGLDFPAADILVGIDYAGDSEIQTLPLQAEAGDGGSATGRRKRIRAVAVHTRGATACQVSQDGQIWDDVLPTVGGLVHGARQLTTGVVRVPMSGGHDDLGQLSVRPIGGLPLTILELEPEYEMGG